MYKTLLDCKKIEFWGFHPFFPADQQDATEPAAFKHRDMSLHDILVETDGSV